MKNSFEKNNLESKALDESVEKAVSLAVGNIGTRLAKMESEKTTTPYGWELFFDLRVSQGLFEILKKKGVQVIRNKDGTVTIRK